MRSARRKKKKKNRQLIAVMLLAFAIILVFGLLIMTKCSGGKSNSTDETNGTKNASAEQETKEYVPDADSEYLILVNKHNKIDEDYKPDDLVLPEYRASDRPDGNQYLRKAAAEAFNKLAADAGKEGHTIAVTTAFRPGSFQKQLYDNYVRKDGREKADTYSARPGYSEHQTGLAADISSPGMGYELTIAFGDTEEGIWVAENCHKYGFIIRYPYDKENITGYSYEPWHLRYVGVEDAGRIYKEGVTLEEYLGQEPAPDYE